MTPEDRKSPHRLARFGKWVRDNPWWASISGLGGVVSVATSVLIALGTFSAHQTLHLRQPSRSGPLGITPESVKCELRIKNLPPSFRTNPPSLEGQLCLVRARVQNETKNQEAAAVFAILYVGESEFPVIAAAPVGPSNLGLLSPGVETVVDYVFDLPSGLVPTRLTFQARPEANSVSYDLRGSI
jgi:hypothetical protein